MADEVIGSIAVQIVGDYSSLQGDIDQATQVAAKGGAEIAQALNAGAAGADALSSAVSAAALGMGSFESQIEALVSSGSTLAEALAAVGTGADAVATGVETAGAAAAEAATQMDLFDAAIEVPYADAAGQLNLFASELEPIAPAAQHANEELTKYTFSAGEAGDKSHEAASGAGELLKGLLEFAGITVSIEALKEFATEAINLYAAEERAGEGIAFLRGNIAEADAVMQDLRATAQAIAEPFDQVAAAAQKMAFFKISAEQTADALEIVADVAKVSGQSFDGLATSLSNIALSGMAMPRTLRQIGVDAKDLADVLGVTSDQLRAVFKAMDEPDRMNALIAAMDRTRGATKAMSDDTTSDLTRMKNSFDFALVDMGSAIAPLAVQAIPSLVDAFKYLVSGAAMVLTGLKFVGDSIAGLASIVFESVKAYGTVWADTVTGNFKAAATAASDALSNIKSIGQVTWQSLASDAKQASDVIDKVWADQTAAAKTSSDAQRDEGLKAAAAAAQAALSAAEAAKELKKETEEVATFAKGIAPALAEASLSYNDYITNLLEGGKKASSVLTQLASDIVKGEAEAAKMSGAPKQAMEDWLSKLREAQKTMEDFAAQDAEGKAWSDILDKRAAYAAKVAEYAQQINDQMVADQQKADLMAEQGALTHQEKLLEIQRSTAAELEKIHSITAFDQLAIDQDLDQKENALAEQALQRELQRLDESLTAEVDYASKREAILLKIQAIEDKIQGKSVIDAIQAQTLAWKTLGIESDKALQTQITEADQALAILVKQHAAQGDIYAGEEKDLALKIQMAERSGADATAQIVHLQNIKLQQQALYDQTHLLGDLYVNVTNDILKGWDQLGKTIADNIIDENNWGQAFLNVGKQVAKMILEEIVGTAFKALKDALLSTNTGIKTVTDSFQALDKAINQALGMGQAATGAASGASGASGMTSSILGSGGMLGAITGIGQLISSIVGNFQMAKLETTMNAVEHNTRFLQIEAEKFFLTDEWDRYTGLLNKLDDIWNAIRDVSSEITKAGLGIMGALGTVPQFASGGMVGADMFARLHAGEVVVPRSDVPLLPRLPSLPQLSSPAAGNYGANAPSSVTGGANTFNIYGASDARETARQIADTLKSLSPKYSAYAT